MASPGLPQPSGKTALTGNGSVKGSAGAYHGYIVTTATATAAITLYDNTTNSGTVIDVIPATTAAGTRGILAQPVPCTNGIYAQFGTATGTVLFLYD